MVNGAIETNWDLTDGNGSIISTGPVTCDFTLYNSSSSGASESASDTKTYLKVIHNQYNNAFTVAWGSDNFEADMQDEEGFDMSFVVAALNGFYDPAADPNLIYWVLPQGGSGNVNDPGSVISFNFSKNFPDSKDVLIGSLRDSGNFFWLGHGDPKYIFPYPSTVGSPSPRLTAQEIGDALGNPTRPINGTNYIVSPYKLVILFACEAYSKSFADAFGIVDFTSARTPASSPVLPGTGMGQSGPYLSEGRSMNTVANVILHKGIPQAYVGWPCNVNAPDNVSDVDSEQADVVDMFSLWETGDPNASDTITDCMNLLSREEAVYLPTLTKDLAQDGIENIKKWELSGCFDLRVTDRYP